MERSAPRQVVEPVLRESVTGKVASSGTRAKMNARGSRGTGERNAARRTESLEEMTDARQNAMMNPIRVFPSIACAAAMRPPSPAIGAVGGCLGKRRRSRVRKCERAGREGVISRFRKINGRGSDVFVDQRSAPPRARAVTPTAAPLRRDDGKGVTSSRESG